MTEADAPQQEVEKRGREAQGEQPEKSSDLTGKQVLMLGVFVSTIALVGAGVGGLIGYNVGRKHGYATAQEEGMGKIGEVLVQSFQHGDVTFEEQGAGQYKFRVTLPQNPPYRVDDVLKDTAISRLEKLADYETKIREQPFTAVFVYDPSNFASVGLAEVLKGIIPVHSKVRFLRYEDSLTEPREHVPGVTHLPSLLLYDKGEFKHGYKGGPRVDSEDMKREAREVIEGMLKQVYGAGETL